MERSGVKLRRPATATRHKFPFRRGLTHDFRLLSCFMPSRRRLRDQLFLFPSDSSAPGSDPSGSDGASSSSVDDADADEERFFSDEENIVTTDSSSSSLESVLEPPRRAAQESVTEELFVFSAPALLADAVTTVETPSFRTLSGPLLSTFSYDCSGDALAISVTTRPSLPVARTAAVVWLPLPALPPDVKCTQSSSSILGSTMSVPAPSSENREQCNSVEPRSTSRQRIMAPVSGGLPLPPPSVATQLLPGLRSFDFEELRGATLAFAPECCLEKGSFGAVYRAYLKQELGPPMAVVRLAPNDNQMLKAWKKDVQTLAQLPRDKNIGVIQGYCEQDRLLVYELSPHGTLRDYLSQSSTSLQQNHQLDDWPLRLTIALGAARGLLYIHDRAPVQVLYRSFKAASVLLYQDYAPRLAGYGLSVTRWPRDTDNSKSFSTVLKISQAHAKTNVWSFGVVLLEILTGRDASSSDEKSFVRWAAPFLKDESKLVRILDARLNAAKGAMKMAALAAQCLKKEPARRPPLAKVVDTLKTLVADSSRTDQQIKNSTAADKRRLSTFGGISFRDAEHRSKFVGQYLSVQGSANDDDFPRASTKVVDPLKMLVADYAQTDQQIKNTAADKRRLSTSGGISFRDAVHRSKFVGQYLSVQGSANDDDFPRASPRKVVVESTDKRPNPKRRVL